jgi:hypothetical protein
MHQPDAVFRAGGAVEIIEQLRVIGMAGKRIHDLDVGPHLVAAAEDGHFLFAIADAPAEGVFRAIADEEHGGFRIADVVLEVVEDAAGLAHAGGGNDDGHAVDVVERLGAADGSDQREVLEAEGVLPLEQV